MPNPSALPQASLFDDALNPPAAPPLAESHEPRPDPAIVGGKSAVGGYSAKDIEVLEGLEPVRKRPGMYIGGTDERALHHLFAEVLDNAMDEAVAMHAKAISVEFDRDGFLTVHDDGRGKARDERAGIDRRPAVLPDRLRSRHDRARHQPPRRQRPPRSRSYTASGNPAPAGVDR